MELLADTGSLVCEHAEQLASKCTISEPCSLHQLLPSRHLQKRLLLVGLQTRHHTKICRSNSVRVPATVVGMAGDGLIHLEYYQDALRVVNRQCKMESMCT